MRKSPVCALVVEMKRSRPLFPDRLEIHETLDQLLERIDVERVHVAGRGSAPWTASRSSSVRRRTNSRATSASITWRCALGKIAVDARGAPEIRQPLARFLRPAADQAVRQHHRIDRAGRSARQAVDADPAVFQQLIDHAPGEGAMGAAALQGEIDALFRNDCFATARRRAPRKKVCSWKFQFTARSSRRRSGYWRR